MKLTEKCLADFESWFSKDFYEATPPNKLVMSIKEFYNLPPSMQFGVFQEWADSVGYIFNVYCNASGYLYEFHRNVSGGGTHLHDSGYEADTDSGAWESRESAQLAAIEKLNEIYNA